MASGSTVSGDSRGGSHADPGKVASSYIEGQLEKTSSEVRLIEISSAVLTVFVAILLYLLVLGIADHWFVRGGISSVTRSIFLLILIAGLAIYVHKRLFPYLRYRISLPYAAHAIEQSEPRLKNSLLNFLFLRRQKKVIPAVVLRGLEQQAAVGLAQVSADLSIERRRLVHIGISVIVVILIGGLYTVLSPKSLLPAVERMLVPWADIDPASRVKIGQIKIDDERLDCDSDEICSIDVALRSTVQISAEVKGLRSGESANIVFSSGGGGAVDQTLPLQPDVDEGYYTAQLPSGEGGIVSDMVCRIEAGDAKSKTFKLKLVPAPSFQVESVEYRYPPYTGLGSRIVQGVGDLRAIEGTDVELKAKSTEGIAIAAVHLEADHQDWSDRSVRMEVAERDAVCQFNLRRKMFEGESIPEFTAYHLYLKTPSGETNQNVVRHQISILRDQAPIVEILEPRESLVEVREDEEVAFEVRGRDPDFRLSELWLVGYLGEEERFKLDLLGQSKRAGELLREVHQETVRFVPREEGLLAGETVSVFAIGLDNKRPVANRTETASVQMRILPALGGAAKESSADSQGNQEPESQDRESQEAESEGKKAENQRTEDSERAAPQQESATQGEGPREEQTEQQSSDSDEGSADQKESSAPQEPPEGKEQSGQESDEQSGQENDEQSAGQQSGESQPQETEQDGASPQGGQSQEASGEGREGSQPQSGGKSGQDEDANDSAKDGEAHGGRASQNQNTKDNNQDGQRDGDTQSAGKPEAGQRSQSSQGKATEDPTNRDGEKEDTKVDNDGEAFEQLRDFIQDESSSGETGSETTSSSESSSSESSPPESTHDTKSAESETAETEGEKDQQQPKNDCPNCPGGT